MPYIFFAPGLHFTALSRVTCSLIMGVYFSVQCISLGHLKKYTPICFSVPLVGLGAQPSLVRLHSVPALSLECSPRSAGASITNAWLMPLPPATPPHALWHALPFEVTVFEIGFMTVQEEHPVKKNSFLDFEYKPLPRL
jgi:hypothetical protein